MQATCPVALNGWSFANPSIKTKQMQNRNACPKTSFWQLILKGSFFYQNVCRFRIRLLIVLPSFFSFILSATIFSVSFFGLSSSSAIKITQDTELMTWKPLWFPRVTNMSRFETIIMEGIGIQEKEGGRKNID